MLKTILLCCLIFCLAVSGAAQSVRIKKDESVDLTQYTTFRVDKGEVVTLSDHKIDENALYQTIKEWITQELTRKGYKAVEDSTAELVISYIGESIVRMDTENLGPLGQSPVTDPSGVDASRTWSREYQQGSIVIDIQDVARKKKVWEARSTAEIASQGDGRALSSVLYKCFKKY
ncbi:MAG TPA: DUF4136 domain-containing protein, partial [Ohtaekwangia sp.]